MRAKPNRLCLTQDDNQSHVVSQHKTGLLSQWPRKPIKPIKPMVLLTSPLPLHCCSGWKPLAVEKIDRTCLHACLGSLCLPPLFAQEGGRRLLTLHLSGLTARHIGRERSFPCLYAGFVLLVKSLMAGSWHTFHILCARSNMNRIYGSFLYWRLLHSLC